MNYLQDYIWCSDSIWGGREYNCRHLVTLTKCQEHDTVDWESIIDDNAVRVDENQYRIAKERYPYANKKDLVSMSSITAPNLKPFVLVWLHRNIKSRKENNAPKGWAVGSAKYRIANPYSFSVFFHRKNDAMAFIREFSIHKKPVHYRQNFSDVQKELDLTTGKYTVL